MNIWHVEAKPSPYKTNGLSNTVWLLAREQVELGHRVILVLTRPPAPEVREAAGEMGIELMHIRWGRWGYDRPQLEQKLCDCPPEIVHLHSVFIPKLAQMARELCRRHIPYIITPHGGLNFRRNRFRKILYSWAIEKSRFANAGAIAVLSSGEARAIRRFVPRYRGRIRQVYNPIDTTDFDAPQWQGNIDPKRVIYLGRFDILQKGIDISIEMARHLPEVEFSLYGNREPKNKDWLIRLQQTCPPNVRFYPPVFGRDKAKKLAEASLYIQTSRWEGFAISIAEAMYVGVPCAVADTLNLAETFQTGDLGLLLPRDPKQAAARIATALNDPDRLHQWSARSRDFARSHFQPRAVAADYLQLYEEVLRS
jgi:glycosyltransferase involved in cell wall biosynthesis